MSIVNNPPIIPVIALLVYFEISPLDSTVAPKTLSATHPMNPQTVGTSNETFRLWKITR